MPDLLLQNTGIPKQFRRAHLSDYITEPTDDSEYSGNVRVLKALNEWAPTTSHPSVLLFGPPARGKTLLASALLNEQHAAIPHQHTREGRRFNRTEMIWWRQRKCPVYFVQMAELVNMHLRLMRLRDEVYRGIRDSEEYLDLDRLVEDFSRRVKFLVLDDVGKEHRTSTGFAQDVFDTLVRTRHNAGLSTIMTSNVPLSAWAKDYSESMQSLIRRSSLVLRLP